MPIFKRRQCGPEGMQCPACGRVFFNEGHSCDSVVQAKTEDGWRGKTYSEAEQLAQGFRLLAQSYDRE